VIALEFKPGSLLDACPPHRLREFEDWLSDFWERDVHLPAAYVAHVPAFHGGVPSERCFDLPSAGTRELCRFFHFAEAEDLRPPLIKSWRSWSVGPDIRLDYRVMTYLDNEFWAIRLDQFELVPFAGLECDGAQEYDLLCLDYRSSDEPTVVVWRFDGSWEDRAITDAVAPSFAAFLPMLRRCPA
jgi:SMI1 / KNR4 family (SUKH-1)